MTEKLIRLKEYLFKRQTDYRLVFQPENQSTNLVLDDLKKFCRGDESCFHADPRIHAVLEGRREVYQRIIDHLEKDSEALWNKYGKGEGL